MEEVIKIRKLTRNTVWKLVFIGAVFSFVPLGFITGILSLVGVNVVGIMGQPVYGLKGFVTALLICGFFCLIFIIIGGIVLSTGLWLYSKFRPIYIKYDYEHPSEAHEVEVEVVKSEPLQMSDDKTT